MSESRDNKASAGVLAFEKAVEKLRLGYMEQLPGRLHEVQHKLAECRLHPDREQPLQELHRQLHTLAGSAGTFGLDDLGAQARRIELLLVQLRHNTSRSEADFEPVAALMAPLMKLPPGA